MCPRMPGERWQSYKPRLDAAHTAFLKAAYPQFGYVRESERHRTVTFDESSRPTTSGRITIQAPPGTDEERAAARKGRFSAEETLFKAPVPSATSAASTTTSSTSTSTATASSTSTSATATTTGDGYPSTGPAALASASSPAVQPASSKGKAGRRNKAKKSSKKAGKSGATTETGAGTVPTEPEPSDAPSTPVHRPLPSSDDEYPLVDVSVSRDFERLHVNPLFPSGQDENTPVAPPLDDQAAKKRATSFCRAGLSLLDDDGDANDEGASFEIPPLLQAPSFRGTGGASAFDPFFVAQMAAFGRTPSRVESEASAMETDKDLLGEFVKPTGDADDDEDL